MKDLSHNPDIKKFCLFMSSQPRGNLEIIKIKAAANPDIIYNICADYIRIGLRQYALGSNFRISLKDKLDMAENLREYLQGKCK